MKKLIAIIVVLLLLGSAVFFFLRFRSTSGGQAVLKVNSTPTATVFLDNKNVGKTPYEDKQSTGEYTLKLIPETTSNTVVSWEGKIKLSPNLLTYVNRDLGDSELTSSGEILSLERASGNKAELAVLSTPDGAVVTLQTEEKGTTPLVLKDIEPNNYELSVSAVGFKSRSVKIKTTAGYKLTAEFQLAPAGENLPSPTPSATPEPGATPKSSPKTSPQATPKSSVKPSTSPTGSPTTKATPPPKPYVQIQDTPTGFLRVRKEPATSAEELAQVKPGEYYSLLDEQNGWFKIEYQKDKEGWISGQYAQKFE